MDQLCQGMVEHGWHVTAFPGNRGCRDESLTYSAREVHQGVNLRRLWRPRFRQAASLGRLLNAAWMIIRWSLLALRPDPPDAILIGTDPILSVTVALAWKQLRPRTRIVQWCFDLYPEAAYADGVLSPSSTGARVIEGVLRRSYNACDAIIDIGPCMRERLARYASHAMSETIVPWALEEPPSVMPVSLEERHQIFGEAQLAMLYSGSFGRAHTYEDFLALARELRGKDAMLAFSVRGNREQELRAAVAASTEDSTCTIGFIPFAPANRLLDRLAAPDIHLLSLAPRWTGTVVPSKFFGALAAGRPVLYSGSPDSSVAQWIEQHQLGWLLTSENVEAVAADLLAYARDPQRVQAMRERCRSTYQLLFSKQSSIDHMHTLLTSIVTAL
jgi:colanic acid biosynthesis glycosyl transferase WcaI